MRILTLLAALLLLAFQARAQTLQETADQVPAQDQPGNEDQDQPRDEDQDQPGDEDQDQPEDEDQDVTVSFTGEERLVREAAGFQKRLCTCRRGLFCRMHESYSGMCKSFHAKGKLCCR